MTSPAALHSADSDEHFTPAAVAQAAVLVMSWIDLDPFSCAMANGVIGASMYYSHEDDGYAQDWGSEYDPQRLFVNPPSSRVKRKPDRAPKALVKPGAIHAWWKLLDEYQAGRVAQAVFLSFNMNLFQTGQRFGYPAPYQFPFVVPNARLKFWGESREPGEGSPSHASAIIYLPPRVAGGSGGRSEGEIHRANLARFREVFSAFGAVRL